MRERPKGGLATAAAVAITLVLAAGCRPADNPSSTTTTTAAATTTVAGDEAAQACRTAQRTIRVAAEAFRANEGRLPTDLDELVESGYLRPEFVATIDRQVTIDQSSGDVTMEPACS